MEVQSILLWFEYLDSLAKILWITSEWKGWFAPSNCVISVSLRASLSLCLSPHLLRISHVLCVCMFGSLFRLRTTFFCSTQSGGHKLSQAVAMATLNPPVPQCFSEGAWVQYKHAQAIHYGDEIIWLTCNDLNDWGQLAKMKRCSTGWLYIEVLVKCSALCSEKLVWNLQTQPSLI